MQPDPLVYFSRAVHAALETAGQVGLLLAGAAALVATAWFVGRRLLERAWSHRAPPPRRPTSRTGAFLDFHTAAEGAAYPALLLVTAASLTIAVAGIVLVALTQTVWALAVAVLSEFVAFAMLGAALNAAFSTGPGPVQSPAETAEHASSPRSEGSSAGLARPAACPRGQMRAGAQTVAR
jgi:hypothetical protein